MSEKKPLADELLREIVPQLKEYNYTLSYSETHLVIVFDYISEAEDFASETVGAMIKYVNIVYIDLYRLAAMGREWARIVGFTISDMALSNGGGTICMYKNIPNPTDDDVDAYTSEKDIDYSPINRNHKTELSATFAAITAVWERVKG